MTRFRFHGNCFRCCKGGSKHFFLQKPLTKDTAQIALFLVFNESVTAKIALCTYLKLTLNGNFVDWA